MAKIEPKKKIVIIGSEGVVGRAYVRFFNLRKDLYDVYGYDLRSPSAVNIKSEGTKVEVYKTDEARELVNEAGIDLAVICVPTPQGKDGVDMSAIHDVFKWLKVPLVLIKSTIPPYEAEKIKTIYGRIVFSPEFLGESKYYIPDELMHKSEVEKHPYVIFGGNKKDCSEIADYFTPIIGPTAMVMYTDIKTAALVKYMENCFFATKVTFCQEMYEIAKAMGIDYNELRELWLLDPRISRMHTSVWKDERGFGGKCFPKDLDGLIKAAKDSDYDADLLKQVQNSNKRFRK